MPSPAPSPHLRSDPLPLRPDPSSRFSGVPGAATLREPLARFSGCLRDLAALHGAVVGSFALALDLLDPPGLGGSLGVCCGARNLAAGLAGEAGGVDAGGVG